jgi:hypothetical protein
MGAADYRVNRAVRINSSGILYSWRGIASFNASFKCDLVLLGAR